jgi:ketosteroid isomerase-like protein
LLRNVWVTLTEIHSCNTPAKEATETVDSATLKQEIEAANIESAGFIAKGDSVGMANFYTEDAKLMFPDAPAIVGRKNIQTAIHNVLDSGIAKAEFKTIDVWGTGDFVSEEGQSSLFDKAGTQVVKDKYIVLWKKEGGKWKPFRDISNSDLPPPTVK